MGHRSVSSTDRTVTTMSLSKAYQPPSVSQTAVRTPTVVTTNPAGIGTAGTTVLHHTILTNKPSVVNSATPTLSVGQAAVTPPIVAQPAVPITPTVVVPVPDPQLVTLANVGNTVTIATTPAPEMLAGDSSPNAAGQPDSPDAELADLQTNIPDSTRTYAMRPRKTT